MTFLYDEEILQTFGTADAPVVEGSAAVAPVIEGSAVVAPVFEGSTADAEKAGLKSKAEKKSEAENKSDAEKKSEAENKSEPEKKSDGKRKLPDNSTQKKVLYSFYWIVLFLTYFFNSCLLPLPCILFVE